MIQELNLSPTGYVILLLIVVWLIIQIAKVPSKIEPTKGVTNRNNHSEPAYLTRYGAVIQMQGRD
ncbi:hypothetical protein Sp14A_17600 [Streptococcus pluranimalium]|uniref:Uncharacterized protein n=1 Tax=Streptococcus pluranimalium TaxID=82348 RepID=A0A345VLR5_9STRE|nr:hypothetical protein Sp14A_17600 [Streptococcus pluranimalium]